MRLMSKIQDVRVCVKLVNCGVKMWGLTQVLITVDNTSPTNPNCPMWARSNPSLPHLLLYLLVSFAFLLASSIFFHIQCTLILCYMYFLVKDAWSFCHT